MRKKLFAVSATLLCICISCNNSSTTLDNPNNNSQAQKNLDAWHVVRMAFANGNPDAVDSVIADDYIDHKSNGDVRSRDSVKANIVRWQTNYKNMKMEVIKELADKDYAFFWMRFTGNSNGASVIPAGPFDMSTVEVVKFLDGKAVEHWSYMDMKEMMKMMSKTGKNNTMHNMDSGTIKNK